MELNNYQVNNYVHIQPAGALEVCSIVGINGELAMVSSVNDPFNNYELPVSELLPIPLTEFILKEFSFTDATGESDGSVEIAKALTKDNVTIGLPSSGNEFYVGTGNLQDAEKVQYVHELQNFFTIKTGNSLKLP